MQVNTEHNISYEFTNNTSHLKAYSKLVLEFYKKDLKLDLQQHGMFETLCLLSANEKVLIAKDGDKVIGGSKIIFTNQNDDHRLPLESDEFSIRNMLPTNFGDYSYCEYARLVLHPNYRGKAIIKNVVAHLTQCAIEHGAGLITLMAPPLNALLYRRVCNGLGMPMQIHNDLKVAHKAAYKTLGLKLITCDIRSLTTKTILDKVAA